ncbi:MAG: haloalkane dehalogenase, partial [Gammaproteobacteria bacterium]|nr:haloalkane dehalogenase [Gammaproteobacteria bacterium]
MSSGIQAKRFVDVLDRRMAYVDTTGGTTDGPSIVFLHGNPTSSYLWRNVIPHVAPIGRCLAPDLIGMGDSEKLDGDDADRYDYETHRRFLDGWMDAVLGDERVVLVVHDWGSALGFDWASRHADRVVGIAYMEALVCPLSWDEWPEPSRPIFEALRSPAGENLILEKNVFIERILPASVQRDLTDEEMDAYRAPFAEPGEQRRPLLSWPRALPLSGAPADVVAIVASYGDWMSHNQVPKLFINAEPGAILVGSQREFCRRWPNQTEITVAGIHFIQE